MKGDKPKSADTRRHARALRAKALAENQSRMTKWSNPIFTYQDAEILRQKAGYEYAKEVTAENVVHNLNGIFFDLSDFAIADAALEPAQEKAERLERATIEARTALQAISQLLENLDYPAIYSDNCLQFSDDIFLGGNKTALDLISYFYDLGATLHDVTPPKDALRRVSLWLDQVGKAASALESDIKKAPKEFSKYRPTKDFFESFCPRSPIAGIHKPDEELARELVKVWRRAFDGRPLAVRNGNEITDDCPACRWARGVLRIAKDRLVTCVEPPTYLNSIIDEVMATLPRRLQQAQRELNKENKPVKKPK